MKSKAPRDGWSGKTFKLLREERGRSREWLAAKIGGSAVQIGKYERNIVYPYHTWRDAAALALNLDRRMLGVTGE